MSRTSGNFPTLFPEVFPRFLAKENNRINGTSGLFPRGYPFKLFKFKGGVLRNNYIFIINVFF